MIIFPAIDLKDGMCVRLHQGEMGSATVYNEDPAEQARIFARAGFSWLHIVDLDGAVAGAPANGAVVRRIVAAMDLPVQLGGGIRKMAQIEHWLTEGVSRVILGTIAVKNPDLVKQACAEFPGQIVLGIDARGGMVATEGWAQTSEIAAADLARRFEDAGAAAIVFTDIERDGTGSGINAEATKALAQAVSIPVIASGGVGGVADLEAVKALEPSGVEGVIVGRALYDGRLSPEQALAAC